MHHRLSGDSDTDFRLGRVLYYLGLVSVAAVAVRPISGLDVSDCFFLASFVAVGGAAVLRGTTVDPRLPRLLVFGFMVFSLGALFSLPGALHPSDSAGAFARFTYTVIVWFALGTIVLRTQRHVALAIAAWIMSNAISGLAAIAQVKWGALLFASLTSLPSNVSGTGFYGRQIGLTAHPNDLGGAAAIVIAPAILFAGSRIWGESQRYAFIALLGLVLACLALSGSVSAFGASIASAAVCVASGRVAIKRLLVLAGILTLTSVALVVINQQGASTVSSPIDRVLSTLGLVTTPLATGLERLNLDAIAWNEIVRNPLYGVGLDLESNAQALGGIDVHNMFLFVWVGAGIFGFLGMLVIVGSLAGSLVAEYRRSTAMAEQTLVLALGASFVSFLIFTLAQPELFVRYGWVPAALLLPLRAGRLRREEAARLLARPRRPTEFA